MKGEAQDRQRGEKKKRGGAGGIAGAAENGDQKHSSINPVKFGLFSFLHEVNGVNDRH